MANSAQCTYAYNNEGKRLRGMQRVANGEYIRETQK